MWGVWGVGGGNGSSQSKTKILFKQESDLTGGQKLLFASGKQHKIHKEGGDPDHDSGGGKSGEKREKEPEIPVFWAGKREVDREKKRGRGWETENPLTSLMP